MAMQEIKIADKETLDEVKTLLENMKTTQVVELEAVGEINKFIKRELGSLPDNFRNMPVVVYNNEIHLLGEFYETTSQPRGTHTKYDGASWKTMGQIVSDSLGFYMRPHLAVVYNDEIYLLGSTNTSNKVAAALYVTWFDSSGSAKLGTLPYTGGNVIGMVVYNNEIHIMGSTKYSEAYNHYIYNGTEWVECASLPTIMQDGLAVVYNDEIHIFTKTKHYKYNGTEWTYVSTLPYAVEYTDDVIIYNNEIHIFYNWDQRHYKYNGTEWVESSGSGIAGCRIIVYNDEIYSIGGYSGEQLKSFYKLADEKFKQLPTMYLPKDTNIYSPNEITSIENCTLDTDHLVVTEDGNVSFGVLTEDTKSLITLC